jgi:hypothetical protein
LKPFFFLPPYVDPNGTPNSSTEVLPIKQKCEFDEPQTTAAAIVAINSVNIFS